MCIDVCIYVCVCVVITAISRMTYYERTPSILIKVDIATKVDGDICCAEHTSSSKGIVAIKSAAEQLVR